MPSAPPSRSGAVKAIGVAVLVIGCALFLLGLIVATCSPGSPGCNWTHRGYLNNDGDVYLAIGLVMALAGTYIGGFQNNRWVWRRWGGDDGD